MLLLPLPTSPAYNVLTEIEGVEYELVYTYDEHRDLWRLGVNRGDVVVMGHRPLLPFVQMRPNAFASALEGVFALIVPLATGDAYEALVGGLWSVVYGDPSEIAELADSLADLAGDADIPVVPIEVLYPPNNAILSNPVVTFSGTGPANQLLFARGESIQVDSMGGWVWTHTFNESNPVVVFEGESGQRATVRFSVIVQPLTINPIGEDIDGTRYVFTESVEVTGTATPNSTITVNGQSVSVDSDGAWSVELTLQAGQSHTITAQAGDGQIAQTSVYVWSGPDVLALQPAVWLDPSDVATLFVDDAMTIPAVDGDPIGGWRNKGTLGATGDAAQPVSASRPVWTGAGGGQIEASGMQRLATQVQNLNYPVECWAVVEPLASVRSAYLSNRDPGTVTSGVNAGISENSLHTVAIRDAGSPVINSAYSSAPSWSVHGPRVVWFRIDREQIAVGQHLEAGERTFDFSRQLLAQLGGPPLEIGTRGADEQIRIGNIILFDRMLTTDERIKIQAYLEAQHGN